jgi:hypothetical protein
MTLLIVVYLVPNGVLGLLDSAVGYLPARARERGKHPILHTREGLR